MTQTDSANEQLEKFFRRLVANLTALDPGALHRPIPVADVHERLVPYRTHRLALGFDSGEDYEMTVLRLLAGEGGYAQLFPEELREAMAKEAASPNPDTGFFRNFPDATLVLDPDRLQETVAGRRGPGAGDRGPAIVPGALPSAEAEPDEPDGEDLPFTLDETTEPEPETEPEHAPRARDIAGVGTCSYCGGSLPVGRTVLFCPHCGQNVGVVHCPTCGSELDVGWQFCITCGQKVTGIG